MRAAVALHATVLFLPFARGQVPLWTPTWALNASSILMVCSYTGYMTNASVPPVGIVDFDCKYPLHKRIAELR